MDMRNDPTGPPPVRKAGSQRLVSFPFSDQVPIKGQSSSVLTVSDEASSQSIGGYSDGQAVAVSSTASNSGLSVTSPAGFPSVVADDKRAHPCTEHGVKSHRPQPNSSMRWGAVGAIIIVR